MKTSNNIVCLTSAGYTSVMMAIKMKEWYPNHNIINVMANTSKERIESLNLRNIVRIIKNNLYICIINQ